MAAPDGSPLSCVRRDAPRVSRLASPLDDRGAPRPGRAHGAASLTREDILAQGSQSGKSPPPSPADLARRDTTGAAREIP